MTRDLLRRLTGAFVGTLVRNTAWAAAVLGAGALVAALAPAPAAQHAAPTSPSVDRVAALVDRHHCWTGESDLPPRRAVVTLPGDDHPRVVPAARGYEIWLEAKPGVLHAFCP